MFAIKRGLGALLLAGGMLAGSLGPAAAATDPGAGATSAAAPIEQASGEVGILEAPVGFQCGAYRTSWDYGAELRYYHCGNSWIKVEVDMRLGPNSTACVGPWEDKWVQMYHSATHAWYNGQTCRP